MKYISISYILLTSKLTISDYALQYINGKPAIQENYPHWPLKEVILIIQARLLPVNGSLYPSFSHSAAETTKSATAGDKIGQDLGIGQFSGKF